MDALLREKVTNSNGEEVEVLIQVEAPSREQRTYFDYGATRGPRDQLPMKAFNHGMQLIRTCAEQVAETIGAVAESVRPDGIEVQLGIKLDGEVGALIAKTGMEAHLHVTLKWSERK